MEENNIKKKKEADIRKRVSYKMFEKIANILQQGTLKEKLLLIHNIMDKYMYFRSAAARDYAKESLDLLINDLPNNPSVEVDGNLMVKIYDFLNMVPNNTYGDHYKLASELYKYIKNIPHD